MSLVIKDPGLGYFFGHLSAKREHAIACVAADKETLPIYILYAEEERTLQVPKDTESLGQRLRADNHKST